MCRHLNLKDVSLQTAKPQLREWKAAVGRVHEIPGSGRVAVKAALRSSPDFKDGLVPTAGPGGELEPTSCLPGSGPRWRHLCLRIARPTWLALFVRISQRMKHL